MALNVCISPDQPKIIYAEIKEENKLKVIKSVIFQN